MGHLPYFFGVRRVGTAHELIPWLVVPLPSDVAPHIPKDLLYDEACSAVLPQTPNRYDVGCHVKVEGRPITTLETHQETPAEGLNINMNKTGISRHKNTKKNKPKFESSILDGAGILNGPRRVSRAPKGCTCPKT